MVDVQKKDHESGTKPVSGPRQDNCSGQYGHHLVKVLLPNQQYSILSIPAGMTVSDALTKALKNRALEPEMCSVFRLSSDGGTKQKIDWGLDVSMLKGDGLVVETIDKVPMHTQLSHNFVKFYLTLSRCHICSEFMVRGIKCFTCGIEFHQKKCSIDVPKLCQPIIEHDKWLKHLLARPTNAHSTSESPTNTTLPIRPRARSADENSRHKSKSRNHHAGNNNVENHDDPVSRNGHSDEHSPSNINSNIAHYNAMNGSSNAMTPVTTSANFSSHLHQLKNNNQSFEERWEIDRDQVKQKDRIGQGSFATVYKGEYHGAVALKEMNVKNPTPAQLQDFKNEINVLKYCRHPNIILFMGYILKPQLIIVTQWCKGQSLYKHLHVDRRRFTNCEIKDIAFGVAQGMEYLHAKKIIHRDLKSNNIFIHDEIDLTVKIGDFGLAFFKTRYEGVQQIYHPTGSILWMAPEVIRTRPGVNPFTFESDVYSYGIVLYELISKNLPYFDFMHKDALFFLIGMNDPELSPKLNLDVISSDIPEALKLLMLTCAERDWQKRPQFASIIKELKQIRVSRLFKSASEPLRLNNLDFSINQPNELL